MYLCTQNDTAMTREQAKQILLKDAEKNIKKYGEDAVAVMSPKIGKDHWTWREVKEAIINDTCLEDSDGMNPIDNLIAYEEDRLKRGLTSMVDVFLKEE